MPPLRFFVDRIVSNGAQRSNSTAINADGAGRDPGARRFIHERHELVREARHGAADANSSDIGTAADPSHPAALGDVAVHHWPPAAQLHDAFRRSVLFGEVALLVVTGAITSIVHRISEQPGGP